MVFGHILEYRLLLLVAILKGKSLDTFTIVAVKE